MAAPEYLHLSGLAVPLAFWGGIALFLTLIAAAAIIALRGEAKAIQETAMTGAEVGYNVALAAAITTTVAVIKKWPRTAIVACLVAWLGIGIDYWLGPPRTWIFAPKVDPRLLLHQPVDWKPFAQGIPPGKKDARYFLLQMNGINNSDTEVVIEDAYFVSGITGSRVRLKVQLVGKNAELADINPVPPQAYITLLTPLNPPNGITHDQFLETWGPFSFVVTYKEKKPERFEVTREDAIKLVESLDPALTAFPHVTLKKPDNLGN